LSPLAEMDGCSGQFVSTARLERPEKGITLVADQPNAKSLRKIPYVGKSEMR